MANKAYVDAQIGGSVGTLSQVLTQGNDAGGNNINNLNRIVGTTLPGVAALPLGIYSGTGDLVLGTSSILDAITVENTSGIATFNAVPVCATQPTDPDQLANKAYVDAQGGGGGGLTYETISGTTPVNPSANTTMVKGSGAHTLSATSGTPGLLKTIVNDAEGSAFSERFWGNDSSVVSMNTSQIINGVAYDPRLNRYIIYGQFGDFTYGGITPSFTQFICWYDYTANGGLGLIQPLSPTTTIGGTVGGINVHDVKVIPDYLDSSHSIYIICGNFTILSNNATVNRICTFSTRTGTYSTLTTGASVGLSGVINTIVIDPDSVYNSANPFGRFWVGGSFVTAGASGTFPSTLNYIAEYSATVGFQPVQTTQNGTGNGVNSFVSSLAYDVNVGNGTLYVAGQFNQISRTGGSDVGGTIIGIRNMKSGTRTWFNMGMTSTGTNTFIASVFVASNSIVYFMGTALNASQTFNGVATGFRGVGKYNPSTSTSSLLQFGINVTQGIGSGDYRRNKLFCEYNGVIYMLFTASANKYTTLGNNPGFGVSPQIPIYTLVAMYLPDIDVITEAGPRPGYTNSNAGTQVDLNERVNSMCPSFVSNAGVSIQVVNGKFLHVSSNVFVPANNTGYPSVYSQNLFRYVTVYSPESVAIITTPCIYNNRIAYGVVLFINGSMCRLMKSNQNYWIIDDPVLFHYFLANNSHNYTLYSPIW
jgi:hypothetical protein